MRAIAPFSVALLVIAGCSATSGPNQFTSGTTGAGGSSGAGGDGVGGTDFSGSGGGSGTAGGSASDCTEAAKLIYVLSTDNDLYSFQPQKKQFSLIGHLGCQTSMQPNSMAVDRDAVAWVNYVESDGFGDTAGAVYKVSTTDASCTPTSVKLGQSWFRLGMGFSSNKAGSSDETLFITGTGDPLGGGSPGLGRIDMATNKVVPVGQFTGSLAGQNAELTGTGDAELYGFFTTTPVHVSKIDKTNGKIVNDKALPAVETPSAWAFSFWGGDFYLYTAPDPTLNPGRTSNVTRYRPSDGTTDTQYMTNVGFIIVGAGVSTCAPLTPPK